jgi:hypothetical protein
MTLSPAALPAGLDIDGEHALEALRTGEGPVGARRREHAVIGSMD